MSMHLEGPGLTTTSYKKRKEKITKAKQTQLEADWRERNQRLKEMGLPKETFEQFLDWVYGRGKKEKEKKDSGKKVAPTFSKISTTLPSSEANKTNPTPNPPRVKEWITGAVSSPTPKTYTGTKVLGIATMHKSNAVPVFSDEEAKEVSSMRR